MKKGVLSPRIEQDIHQYITKVFSSIKERKPHHLQQSSLGTIVTSQALHFIGISTTAQEGISIYWL